MSHFGDRGFPLGVRGTSNGGVDIENIDLSMNIICARAQGLTTGVLFPTIEGEIHMLEGKVLRNVIEQYMEPARRHGHDGGAFHLVGVISPLPSTYIQKYVNFQPEKLESTLFFVTIAITRSSSQSDHRFTLSEKAITSFFLTYYIQAFSLGFRNLLHEVSDPPIADVWSSEQPDTSHAAPLGSARLSCNLLRLLSADPLGYAPPLGFEKTSCEICSLWLFKCFGKPSH